MGFLISGVPIFDNDYLTKAELSCSCCEKNYFNDEMLRCLIRVIERYRNPMVINSGYRCPNHNTRLNATMTHATGDTVHIAENTYYMVHNPSAGVHGDERALEKTKNMLAKVKTTMIGLYSSRTGMSDEETSQVLMGNQKDGDAAVLNIRPKFLLCDIADEGSAKVTLEPEFEVGESTKNNTTPNSVSNIAEAHL
ncbi:hypothetical protein BTJ40_04215 [Microbulbifer sp. A4B17]|uniref:D-Ala-D-Ala carboxypeptidase family metallohydrolase n=1 Tax=Microbulbifer sp. A4B17 TaxID=359370 RepID=UPI000D52E096|nr:ATP-dependent Clp protease proteolytic subunit [Microbulbifer sp. A4B17]AWF80085.1 hypothetical protein BTJ40_04215 [Microbulbifer sp. A4B17]